MYYKLKNTPTALRDVPWRYHTRRFTLIGMHGDYGVFCNPDRNKPFIFHINDVVKV